MNPQGTNNTEFNYIINTQKLDSYNTQMKTHSNRSTPILQNRLYTKYNLLYESGILLKSTMSNLAKPSCSGIPSKIEVQQKTFKRNNFWTKHSRRMGRKSPIHSIGHTANKTFLGHTRNQYETR